MRMKPISLNYKKISFFGSSDYEDDRTSFTFDYHSFKPTVHEQPFNIDDDMSKAYQE